MKKLWSSESAAVAPLVGVCAIVLVGSVAVAVDIGRGQVAQSKLQGALDAAGLAAGAIVGQNITEEKLRPEARKYLDANFGGTTIDASVVDFKLKLSENKKVVTLRAQASLPTTFMKIFGKNIMKVAARSEITRETTGLEVALVLDVTGSMEDPIGGTGLNPEKLKIVALRESAVKLVDALFGEHEEVEDLWVGVVPFSQSVNIGTNHANWLSDLSTYTNQIYCSGPTSGTPKCTTNVVSSAKVSTRTNPVTLVNQYMDADNPVPPKVVVPTGTWTGTLSPWYFRDPVTAAHHGWGGCVLERWTNSRDVTDDPPTTQKWQTYFVPDTAYNGNNNWRGPTNSTGTKKNGDYLVDTANDISANKGCPEQAITTFTNKRSDLTTAKAATEDEPAVPGTTGAIDVLLNPRGNTHINVGAVWGWRLLSPEWRDKWGGTMDTNDLPLDYDDPKSHKVMILMTDGTNTMSDTIYTAYGWLSDNHLGTTNSTTATTKLNNRTAAVCTAMKAKGIVIYTIVFGNDSSTGAKNLMKGCASQTDYYFDSDSQAKLENAFATIGDSLSKLRVSQ
ncbi:MAG TPA: pilus assembly protein TadG-related protein [Dongiaceae bacterium]|nr:pilus assembly protein TadG-related protein [Dongiaceae bacterium]